MATSLQELRTVRDAAIEQVNAAERKLADSANRLLVAANAHYQALVDLAQRPPQPVIKPATKSAAARGAATAPSPAVPAAGTDDRVAQAERDLAAARAEFDKCRADLGVS